LAFEDEDRSWAGSAPVDGLHHPLGFELFDRAHLVIDEWSEPVWLSDRASRNSDHVRLLWVVRFGMVTASDGGCSKDLAAATRVGP
jgi:hypothetical protein